MSQGSEGDQVRPKLARIQVEVSPIASDLAARQSNQGFSPQSAEVGLKVFLVSRSTVFCFGPFLGVWRALVKKTVEETASDDGKAGPRHAREEELAVGAWGS